MNTQVTLSTHQHEIPEGMLAPLRDSADLLADPDALRARMEEDGYLYLHNVLDRDAVHAARMEVITKLGSVGEFKEPFEDGISTGTSQRGELISDLGAFWQSICEGRAVRAVTHAGPIREIMETYFGEPVRAYDFLWLRTMHPGRASAFHFDHVYMNRGTDRLCTVWTPLGDVALEEGPLLLVEDSHRWTDLHDQFRGLDVDKDKSRPGHVTLDPVSLARERGVHLLTAEFKAGDVVIMPMFMLHGSLDNRSPRARVRISCDTRYQPAAEPADERWVGENPIAHGQGYSSMGGAKPATSDPLFR
ncbi:MAG: phytanoyl-CoA dioxygenase family protein [Candidatus Hydrogenedentes bacterium]|nr:phytanoyl-CoA dioxygenase family protein [Candidatus Hydrogenedentota bacterium]